jgi:Zn-dependent peptidase ImmA (M78 family)
MPQLRCSVCGHTFFERSDLAAFSPCPECGEEETVELDYEEPEPEPTSVAVDPMAQARSAAANVLADHKVEEPPVPVASLAEAMGLTIERRPLGDHDGELRRRRIIVNRDHHRVRQRFTIAHELGHFVLHSKHGSDESAERQANAFAGGLLIPPPLLRLAIRETPDASSLRQRFDVSEGAIWIAVRQAGLTNRVQSTLR